MIELLSMDYAPFVYSSFIIFISVLIICAKDAFNLNKKYQQRVQLEINQLNKNNET